MQPIYAVLSSSGSTRWFQTDWFRGRMQLGVSVVSGSSTPNWSLDVTMDDPTGYYPNPSLNPGTFPPGSGGKAVTVFSAASLFGSSNLASSVSSASGICVINQPITAWRLTQNSTSGTVTASVLQPCPR